MFLLNSIDIYVQSEIGKNLMLCCQILLQMRSKKIFQLSFLNRFKHIGSENGIEVAKSRN